LLKEEPAKRKNQNGKQNLARPKGSNVELERYGKLQGRLGLESTRKSASGGRKNVVRKRAARSKDKSGGRKEIFVGVAKTPSS
jgi:hypothetical protein